MRDSYLSVMWIIMITMVTILLSKRKSVLTEIPSHIYSSLKARRILDEDPLESQLDPFATNSSENIAEKRNRLLCWVMINPSNFHSRGVAIKDTWGKRCDKLIFMSSQEDKELGAVDLKVSEGYLSTWPKTRQAFKYLYDHHLNEYDWFLKADDDTYLIVENLRYLLTLYDTDFPIALGEQYHRYGKQNYLTGGAGYVLNRAALIRYAKFAYPIEHICPPKLEGRSEDMKMGRCMLNAGIMLVDTRDENGQGRFFQQTIEKYISASVGRYPHIAKYNYEKGLNYISPTAISFHDMKKITEIYAIEFLIYRLQVYGFHKEAIWESPPKLPPNRGAVPKEVLQRFGQ